MTEVMGLLTGVVAYRRVRVQSLQARRREYARVH